MYCIVLVMTQTMTKPSTATRAQVDSKALFARLLAAESIVVEHRRDAHTAWFETDTRRLVLPVWQDMSNETYNMLVAHEVSHALYSPKGTSWLDDLTRIDPDNAAVVKGFFNIVEDARIERLIKVRYPGLRSDFLSAYRSLFDQDKFGIKGQDVATMSLIDRINLHYKVGVFVNVPFSAEELPLVRECAETKTYADALDLTRRLYEFAKSQKEDQDQDQEVTEDGQAEASSDGDDTADATEETSEGEGEGETETSETAPTGSGESGSETQQEQTGESQKSGKTEDAPGQGNAGAGTGSKVKPDAPVTDNVLNNLSEQHRDGSQGPCYMDAPIFDEKIGVFTPAEIASRLDASSLSQGWREKGQRLYQEFLTENRDAINLLAREFEQKRAAAEFLRTRQADSGSVDPNRLWSYRIDENIFSSYEVKSSGKNHGLIFYVDWSGSMSHILYETVKQAVCLAEFCRKVNIPFEVHAFSDTPHRMAEGENKWDTIDSQKPWKNNGLAPATAAFVQLVNWLNGTLNSRQYRDAVSAFLYVAKGLSGDWRTYPSPHHFNLGGTPLVAAATAALTQLPRFKRQHGLQIVHTVFLTDGGAGDSLYASSASGGRPVVRFNGWESQRDGWDTLSPVLDVLRRTNDGSNVIGFFLDSKRNIESRWPVSKGKGFICLPNYQGYSQWFGIVNSRLDEVDHFDKFDNGQKATAATVRSAMVKEFAKVRANRQFLSRFIDLIAKAA